MARDHCWHLSYPRSYDRRGISRWLTWLVGFLHTHAELAHLDYCGTGRSRFVAESLETRHKIGPSMPSQQKMAPLHHSRGWILLVGYTARLWSGDIYPFLVLHRFARRTAEFGPTSCFAFWCLLWHGTRVGGIAGMFTSEQQ